MEHTPKLGVYKIFFLLHLLLIDPSGCLPEKSISRYPDYFEEKATDLGI